MSEGEAEFIYEFGTPDFLCQSASLRPETVGTQK